MPADATLRRRVALFAALSATDFALTWWLLDRSGGAAYEANPLAARLLADHGWAGLAVFKAGAVAAALGLLLAGGSDRPPPETDPDLN